ncbi:sensor histidine kinase, partial [Acinetobacter baumannii]
FHELATNAIKYGALSRDGGQVVITVIDDPQKVQIDWREQGGPAVSAPGKMEGFGSRLVELSVVRHLGGVVEREWAPDGLRINAE